MPESLGYTGGAQQVTDYTTAKDTDGLFLQYPTVSMTVRCSAAVKQGNVLMWVIPTATVPISATKMSLVGTSATSALKFAGVALSDGDAGQYIEVAIGGVCAVLTDADPSAFVLGDAAIAPTTTVGTAARIAQGSLAAGTIVGLAFGRFLGPGVNATPPYALIQIGQF